MNQEGHDTEINPEMKFGVPKVFKYQFDEEPGRYELRKNFPDMPACPWGNSFSMMGFDKQDEMYVWLVKSIIKDDRLAVIEYHIKNSIDVCNTRI